MGFHSPNCLSNGLDSSTCWLIVSQYFMGGVILKEYSTSEERIGTRSLISYGKILNELLHSDKNVFVFNQLSPYDIIIHYDKRWNPIDYLLPSITTVYKLV